MSNYLPHVLYSLAITSISLHLLNGKKAAEESRRHYAAQISILESIRGRMAAGEDVSDAEIGRLTKLVRANTDGEDSSVLRKSGERLGWRDMLLGKKQTAGEVSRGEEYERRELEQLQEAFTKET